MEREKPIIEKSGKTTRYFCPKCKNHILSTKELRQSGVKVNYCPECGQGIDWSGITLEVYWAN